jgi:hypothetical protein
VSYFEKSRISSSNSVTPITIVNTLSDNMKKRMMNFENEINYLFVTIYMRVAWGKVLMSIKIVGNAWLKEEGANKNIMQ